MNILDQGKDLANRCRDTVFRAGKLLVEQDEQNVWLHAQFPANRDYIHAYLAYFRGETNTIAEPPRQIMTYREVLHITPAVISFQLHYVQLPSLDNFSCQCLRLPDHLQNNSPLFAQQEFQKILQRYARAIQTGELEEMKLSDLLAYRQDTVYSTAIFLVDAQGRVLLQQRSFNSATHAGYYQPTANGKLETWKEALLRELGGECGPRVLDVLDLSSVRCVDETGYVLVKHGIAKPAIGRVYVANVGDQNIDALVSISPEVHRMQWITREDLLNGSIVTKTEALKHQYSPQDKIIMFDDQYAALVRILIPDAQSSQ